MRSLAIAVALALLGACSSTSAPVTATVPAVTGVGVLPITTVPCIPFGPFNTLPAVLPPIALYVEVRESEPVTVSPAMCAALGTPVPPCMAPTFDQCVQP